MPGMQRLFMNYGPQLLLCDSADFDGSNDYMTRGAGLDGAADSKSGIFSCWARLDVTGASNQWIMVGGPGGNGSIVVLTNSSNQISVAARNTATTIILNMATVNTYEAAATWLHILASWDLATSSEHLYINDVLDVSVSTSTDDTIDYTGTDWAIGALVAGSEKFNGCLAEFYFAPGQYLDFSNVYQRRKFISSSGKPVYLGAAGATPTGTAPIIYQRVAVGAAVATFATNLGTGGDFAITGTLTDGSTSPSD